MTPSPNMGKCGISLARVLVGEDSPAAAEKFDHLRATVLAWVRQDFAIADDVPDEEVTTWIQEARARAIERRHIILLLLWSRAPDARRRAAIQRVCRQRCAEVWRIGPDPLEHVTFRKGVATVQPTDEMSYGEETALRELLQQLLEALALDLGAKVLRALYRRVAAFVNAETSLRVHRSNDDRPPPLRLIEAAPRVPHAPPAVVVAFPEYRVATAAAA